MARRMLSLAALLSPRRWRSVPAVRCLRSTCNRWRVSYLSSLRSLCRAVQGQAELASSKALEITASAICWPSKALDTQIDTVLHCTNSVEELWTKKIRSREQILSSLRPSCSTGIDAVVVALKPGGGLYIR